MAAGREEVEQLLKRRREGALLSAWTFACSIMFWCVRADCGRTGFNV